MKNLFDDKKFECRVSSVLQKNIKSYGKQFMFDNDDESCWNSESGSPQWVLIRFPEEVELASVEIQFQGGFAGKKCHLEAGLDSKSLEYLQDIFPEDTNAKQLFKIDKVTKSKVFKLVFESSTDFFGRIIIYKMSFNSS